MNQSLIISIFLLLSLGSFAQSANLGQVNPFVGTGGHGHTFPGAVVPFGMVQLSPDTRREGWDACSGYHYDDSSILGFSHTHLSGTGIADLCDVLVTPSTTGDFSKPLAFRHSEEKAAPGYYAVDIDSDKMKVELTTTKRVGMHRYTFPSDVKKVWIRVVYNLRNRIEVSENLELSRNKTYLTGAFISDAWAKKRYQAFAMEANLPFVYVNKLGAEESTESKVFLEFDVSKTHTLLLKVALSPVSQPNARTNMRFECKHWNFKKVRRNAAKAWQKQLGRVKVSGGSNSERAIFYTALYHSFIHPSLAQDINGDYRGLDGHVYHSTQFDYHSIFSLWDTYRALHPLFTLVCPDKLPHFINGFLDDYERVGHLPMWNFPGNETFCMIGNHAVPVIADAYLKGIRGFDEEKALQAMIASVRRDQFGLQDYTKNGYVPADKEHESVSKTLEYAYDDHCISRMAAALGKDSISQVYYHRSQQYRNLFNPATQFFQAKGNATFATPFDPREVNVHYTEGNAWQYAFAVQHDMEGLTQLLGGKAALEAKLDQLFSAQAATTGRAQVDITGLIGQYAHGNEPSHHIAYLYHITDKPEKTNAILQKIWHDFYKNSPDGLIGNEDCGQMSAWYVLSTLGYYPVNPCGREGEVDTPPLFKDAKIFHPLTGKMRSLKAARTYQLSPVTNVFPTPKMTTLPPNPYIAQGSKTFTGSQIIALACIDKAAMIWYSTQLDDEAGSYKAYTQPLTIGKNTQLRFYAEKAGLKSKTEEASFLLISVDREATFKHPPAAQYSGDGANTVADGLPGAPNWQLGGWQGFEGVEMEVTIDRKDTTRFSSVALSYLEDQNAWIFPPKMVVLYGADSRTGEYKELGSRSLHIAKNREGMHTDKVEFEVAGNYRYLRIAAESMTPIPAWHKGAGGKGWIFVDEVVIR